MLHKPELGGTGQSAACVAAVHTSEQNVRLPPMKQTLLAHSDLSAQGAPNGKSPPSLPPLLIGGGMAPPQPPAASAIANTIRRCRMHPPLAHRRSCGRPTISSFMAG